MLTLLASGGSAEQTLLASGGSAELTDSSRSVVVWVKITKESQNQNFLSHPRNNKIKLWESEQGLNK